MRNYTVAGLDLRSCPAFNSGSNCERAVVHCFHLWRLWRTLINSGRLWGWFQLQRQSNSPQQRNCWKQKTPRTTVFISQSGISGSFWTITAASADKRGACFFLCWCLSSSGELLWWMRLYWSDNLNGTIKSTQFAPQGAKRPDVSNVQKLINSTKWCRGAALLICLKLPFSFF